MIDKVLSPGRSLLCNPFAQQQTRLVMVLFDNLYPPHKVIKTLPLFFFPIVLYWTTALFILHYCVLMELCWEKINAKEPPVFRESTHKK